MYRTALLCRLQVRRRPQHHHLYNLTQPAYHRLLTPAKSGRIGDQALRLVVQSASHTLATVASAPFSTTTTTTTTTTAASVLDGKLIHTNVAAPKRGCCASSAVVGGMPGGVRWFSRGHHHHHHGHHHGKRHKKKPMLPQDDPFFILGFERHNHGVRTAHHHHKKKQSGALVGDNETVEQKFAYTAVKKRFLQIAMKHHPDTFGKNNTNNNNEEQQQLEEEEEKHREIFIKARKAFEAIVEGPDGMALLRSESDLHDDDEEEDFGTWFKHETGHDMPFMDATTMKEVAEMTESVGGGLDRDGGMWTLARMVTASVKNGGDAKSLLQLEAGTVRSREINGILRRRRRRTG